MSTQRWMLSVLLLLALLAPGAAASRDQPAASTVAAHQIGASSTNELPVPSRATPDDWPWYGTELIASYAELPACTAQSDPAIAADPAGNAYIVWTDNRLGNPDIYFGYRSADGRWSSQGRVNDAAAGANRGSADIAVDSAGNAYAVWTDSRDGNPAIYFAFRPAGGAWGVNVVVSQQPAASQGEPAIAVSSTGNAYAVWQDNRNGHWDIYSSYRPAGGSWELAVKVNDDLGATDQTDPDIALDADGNAMAVWVDERISPAGSLYSAHSTAPGTWEANERVGHASGYWLSQPAVAVDPAGNAHALWRDFVDLSPQPYQGYFVRRAYRPHDGSWQYQGEVDSFNAHDPGIAVDAAGHIFTVNTHDTPNWGLWHPKRVNFNTDDGGPGGFPSAQRNGSQSAPAIAVTPDGQALAAWVEDGVGAHDIYFAIRPPAGAWTASERVNDEMCNHGDGAPRLAVDAAGASYVVWADDPEGHLDVFFAQRPEGGSWSSPTRINDDPGAADQIDPGIAVDGNGVAYAAWEDWRSGRPAISFASRTPDGNWSANVSIGSGFSNANPDIAANQAGDVAIVWSWWEFPYPSQGLGFAFRPAGGDWTVLEHIPGTQSDSAVYGRVAMAATGVVWVVFRDGRGDRIKAISRSASGAWSAVETVQAGFTNYLFAPDIALDANGTPFVVWREGLRYYDEGIAFAQRQSDGTWSSRTRVSDRPGWYNWGDPTIDVDAIGNVYVSWADTRNGDSDIYFAYRPAGGAWSANKRVNDDSSASYQGSPAIGADAAGNAYAVWYDARGTPVTPAVAFSYASASTLAAPGDEYWATGFHLPGMDYEVSALAMGPDGSLYAGGWFSAAGGVTAYNIARYDGSQWLPVSDGVNNRVSALAFGGDGWLYVGGYFTTTSGRAADYIARWDGVEWWRMESGMDGYVSALTVGPDGSLFAGGSFTTAGDVAANRVARWDGNQWQWHPLGSGMNDTVYALAYGADGSLYAGGDFTTAGGVAANHIARWDGATSSWHPLGNGMNDGVNAVVFGPDGSLYAGGRFTTAGGVAANRVARWDGDQWHPLGSGMSDTVHALAFGPDGFLYGGGDFTTAGGIAANRVARWDGATSSWHPLGSGMNARVAALAANPDGSLYAGGHFTTAGEGVATYIARWNGSAWHAVSPGNGMGGMVGSLALGLDGSLYAGGEFTMAGEVIANHTARWDGSQWHPLGSGTNNYEVHALAVGPDGSLYAGGDFTTAGGIAANSIARWDGSQWHPLGSGMEADSPVFALAFGPDGSLYAGGNFITAGGVPTNHIARWDGAQWHPLGNGMSGSVSALAVGPDGSLYAGGSFTTAGGIAADRIARWDGSQWRPVGSGMNGSVYALTTSPDGSLYAGGSFTAAGGIAAGRIARWDGSQWHPLGSGMEGTSSPRVHALAIGPDGSLYAGGSFTTAGEVAANHAARWDGITASWHPLGSGMGASSQVFALAVGPDSSLYAGGPFTTAGDKPSTDIAQWNAEAVSRCDFNASGAVDVGDIMIVAALWNQPAGPPYDLDGDGVITVVDIQRVARWWDWSVP